ncbi:MAG: 4-hydroxybenzoate octaprenyltransferase [Gammaproteobacteria bacterium]|nr:4-hydroxybenzoate octaprenyltransferase [Gammaproteobacteria bacterium]MDH5593745.1 4-hydroxybenzoate octaprenyltransferase [Gammaproteobacteria bacterium]
MNERLFQYALLMRLDKPIGILLLLWPTLWALFIAGEGHPDGLVLFVFVTGVILMRSAGCVINDYADRKIDPYVTRTRERPIASGKISSKEALILFSVLCVSAFVLVLFMNKLTIMMSFVGAFLAATYPFMKRYTYLPQPYLGAAFGWAIPMAFAAQTGEVPVVAWLMFIAVVLWATAYDTMYAMVDRRDDLRIGVKSTAILFGDADRIIIGLIQLTLIWVLILVGRHLEFGIFYYMGIVVAAGMAGYQQYLIYKREPEKCFRAFLNNNWFGVAIFGGITCQYYLT